MWIKAAVLGGSGIVFGNLGVWTMAGLGITVAFRSSRKWVESVVVAREEEKDNEIDRLLDKENDNEIDRLLDKENDNEIDRLPDDILGDILSRLTLIEASRTSVLSRRWRFLWTMKSELVFSTYSKSFLKAVDQCLQLYSDHGRKMREIRLPGFLNVDTCHLVRWMKALARLDVEIIYLGNSPSGPRNYQRPAEKDYTFSFKLIDGLCKLKFIRLLDCYVETSFVGQCFSLTRIYLGFMLLLSHQLDDILMSCPNLGIISILRCELPPNIRFSGSNLKLKNIGICKCFNVQKIEISDINVMTVSIDVGSGVEILLSSLPQIQELVLSAPETDYRFGDVRRDLPELQKVTIKTPYQVLWLPPTFRAFRNVRRLVIVTSGIKPPIGREKLDLWNFAQVLDAFPLLEDFYLAVEGPICSEEERKEKWPVTRHKHLRLVELSGFSNTQNELEFARFILTSAEALCHFLLYLCPRRCYLNSRIYVDESEKDSKKIDPRVAKAVRADLRGHALSIHARVLGPNVF